MINSVDIVFYYSQIWLLPKAWNKGTKFIAKMRIFLVFQTNFRTFATTKIKIEY